MESEWSDQSNNAIGRRADLMKNFDCCGFYIVTDSYQFAECPKLTSSLLSCQEATQNYLETDVYPIARGAIGIGVIEVRAFPLLPASDSQDETERGKPA